MHRDPLTCCALSFVHGFESDSKLCDCACFNDERDLDPTTNTCPLIIFPDIEGSEANGCSLAAFHDFVNANHFNTLGLIKY